MVAENALAVTVITATDPDSGTVFTFSITGGAAANRAILQVMADVFGADVFQLEVGNSAALGAALRAFHADQRADGREMSWEDVIAGFVEPLAESRVSPDASRHELYTRLIDAYAACEAHALGRGPDPAPLLASL